MIIPTDGFVDRAQVPAAALVHAADQSVRSRDLEASLDSLQVRIAGTNLRVHGDAALLLVEELPEPRMALLALPSLREEPIGGGPAKQRG